MTRLPKIDLVTTLELFGELPEWFAALGDPAAVGAALVVGVAELASGRLQLRSCQLRRVRIKKDSRAAAYRVTLGGAGGDRVVDLLGEIVPPGAQPPDDAAGEPFGSDRWHFYAPELRLDLRVEPPEEALPAVRTLTDPESARALLESAIRSGSPAYADLRIAACSPRVQRVKQSRCTVLYDLEFPPVARGRGWPTPVVAKTYGGTKGRRAYDGMSTLWQSPLSRSRNVRIAEPLAYVPELALLVQGPVPAERTLKEVARAAFETGAARDELRSYVEQTAVGLAELHTCGAAAADDFGWGDKLDDISEVAARAAQLAPSLAEPSTRLLRALDAAAAELPADAAVPTHGSFRPNQVVLGGSGIAFIDFDRFSMAEPAADVSSFLTAHRDIAFRAGSTRAGAVAADELARLDELSELFLERYAALAPLSRARLAVWEGLEIFNTVLDCWIKLEPGLQERVRLLAHHLEQTDLPA